MVKYEAKISEIREKIVREIDPEKIILFGSYAWGTPNDDSDVDLLVVQKTDESRRVRQISLRQKLSGSGVPMDILVYTPEEIKESINEKRSLFVEDIVRNGKTIYEKSADTFGVVLPARPLIILQ